MNIKVYQNRETHQIDNDVYGTQNENNVTELKIEVPEQYENWNKRIVFLTDEGNFWDYIKDNTYTIKNNITKYEELEAYIWLTENAESTEESINDFRSRTFRLSFFANENADDLVPDEQQIDGFNTMITALNVEIKEVKQINTDFTKLKQEVEQAEDERNKAETERNTAEKAREKAETERETAENNRASAETERETAESIRKKNESNRIVNENGRIEAENNRSSAEEARATAEDKRKTYINNLKKDIENGELNGATFTPHLDSNGNLSWTNNKNLDNPTEINIMGPQGPQGQTYQVTEEDLQAIADKITADANSKFNNNVTKQTNTFNNNADTKQTEYDNNATAKLEEYNNNSTAKVNEFNENAQSYATELEELASQMPWNTTDISESIYIEDSAKYSRNKLDVFGNLKQGTRSGKNKFKIPESATSNGITYTKNADGTFNLSGTATESAVFQITVEIEKTGISWGNQITLSSNVTTDINKFMALQATNGNTWVSSLCALNTGSKKLTVTLTKPNTTHIRFLIQVNKGQTIDWKNAYIQLENNPDATDFEAYGEMPSIDYPSMPVVATGVQKITKCRKNFINIKEGTISSNEFTVTVDSEKVIHIDGTNNIENTYPWLYLSKNRLEIKHGTPAQNITLFGDNNLIDNDFTINFAYNGDEYYDGTKQLYNKDKYIGAVSNSQNNTKSFNDGINGICIYLGSFGKKYTNATIEIMLNEGLTQEIYEPYNGEDITLDLGTTELCKITDSDGNVVAQDRPVYRLQVDGTYKWQWEKNVAKIILNGTETWKIDPLQPNCNYRSFYTTSITKMKEKSFVISNLLKNNIDVYYYDYLGIYVNWQSSIRIKNGVSTTVKELKTWLSANNLTCYSVLKSPEYEDCTAEQSEVLDKLYKLQLEKGVNNIFVESENGVTTELQLEYMQDNNLIKEQQHKAMKDEIDTLKQAVVALGGVL